MEENTIEWQIKRYKECDKKKQCQLGSSTYLCDNIKACTYIHYYENKINTSNTSNKN